MSGEETTMSEGSMKVKDIMAQDITTLGRNDSLDLADDVMTLGRMRHIPVIDKGQVVGVVSQRALFRSALAVALGYGETAKEAAKNSSSERGQE